MLAQLDPGGARVQAGSGGSDPAHSLSEPWSWQAVGGWETGFQDGACS